MAKSVLALIVFVLNWNSPQVRLSRYLIKQFVALMQVKDRDKPQFFV